MISKSKFMTAQVSMHQVTPYPSKEQTQAHDIVSKKNPARCRFHRRRMRPLLTTTNKAIIHITTSGKKRKRT
jgi:hypothetical protein